VLINLRSKQARKKFFVLVGKVLLMTLVLFAIAGMMVQGDWWQAWGLLTLLAVIVIIPWIFPPKKDRPKTR
jgi:uncharacterized membrane protein YhaH (DUF805 family)